MVDDKTKAHEVSIQVDKVTKVYKQGKQTVTALDKVSLQIHAGEIYGIIGVNGSGKTTLAKIIATLTLPDQGRVRVQQWEATEHPEKVKECMGLSLGVDRSFYYRLTAKQNLEYFGTMHEIPSRLLRQRIDEYLGQFDLSWAKKMHYMKFSSGMKRKLDLIRSMLPQPSIFILDEPTNGIDPHSQTHIRKVLRQLKKEQKTIMLITHNLHEADLLCDRIGILDQGKLVWQGSVGDFEQYKGVSRLTCETDQHTISLKDEEKLHQAVSSYPCIRKINIHSNRSFVEVYYEHHELNLNHVLNLIASLGLPISKINTMPPTIEDIFNEFVSHQTTASASSC